MVTLFDEEKIREIHDYNIALEARQEGIKKGRQEGRREGRENGIRATISTLRKHAFGRDAVVQSLIEEFDLPPHIAEEKVTQYWLQG